MTQTAAHARTAAQDAAAALTVTGTAFPLPPDAPATAFPSRTRRPGP